MALPAGAQPPGPEIAGRQAIFFPYVPNGVDIEEGNGPWYGVITVQNLEDYAVDIEIRDASGDTVTTATLNAHASKTFSADLLGIDDESAGAVYVVTQCVDTDSVDVTKGPLDSADIVDVPGWDGDTGSIVVSQGETTYVQGTDYSVVVVDADTIQIDWATGNIDADEPAPGSIYEVEYGLAELRCDRVGGIEKHASVDLSSAGRTSEDTVAVTGYTALPLSDVALSRGLDPDSTLDDVLGETGQWNWAFPIVQTNNGWNSVIHVRNFSGVDNCGITVTFYQSPSGSSDPSFGSFTTLLDAGQMVDVDLLAEGFPSSVNDWVGQAWVSADCAIAATVDRLKDETDMALTLIPQPRVDTGEYAKYGPLVYENFSGWNTGITFANLSDTASNTVTISFYNQNGQLVSSDQRVLQPRAVEYIYRPATANQELGGPVGSLQQVVVQGTAPLAAAADSVKYLSGREEGQALSYLLQGGAAEGETLSVALIQKGTSLAPSGQFSGDTSGVQLFNTSSTGPATVWYAFFDQTGALVAPTLTGPVATTIGALGAATLYTPFFAEMPNGFQGSFLATVVSGGPVAAVSNTVNYDVVGDGTAAYNAFLSTGLVGFNLALDPAAATNLAGTDHTVTATLTFGTQPVEGVDVLFTVTSEGNPNPASGTGVTNGDGEAAFTYTNDTAGDDTITACADLNGNSVCDTAFEPTATASKTWIIAEGTLALNPTSTAAANVGDNTADTTATVTVTNTTDPVPVVLVIADVSADGSFAVCSAADDNDTAGTTSGGATNTFTVNLYACAGASTNTFDVAAYHDVNRSGSFDSGTDVQIGTTQTFTLP